MEALEDAISECETCASLAEYTHVAIDFARKIAPADLAGAVLRGDHIVSLARWAQGRTQQEAEAVLDYIVGRGRSEAPVYKEAVEIAFKTVAAGLDGRGRAAAVVAAFQRDDGARAPRRSPMDVHQVDGERIAQTLPADLGEEGYDARPAWAALAAHCARAPARGIPPGLAAAMFDAIRAASATREYLSGNAAAASAIFDIISEDGGDFAISAADCEDERLFSTLIEHGAVDILAAYVARYGVPSEDARREAEVLVEAWADSFDGDARPQEGDELLAALRAAEVHETSFLSSVLSYND